MSTTDVKRPSTSLPTRRTVLKAGAVGAAGLALPALGTSQVSAGPDTWSSIAMHLRRQESVNLQVTVWLGDQEFTAMEELAGHFTEANPSVTVDFVNIIDGGPWGRDQLQRMIAGGEPPDLMMLNTGQFEAFGSRGALANLEERVTADSFDLGVYFPPAVDGCRIDGDLYALPKDITDQLMFFNTDWFAEAGVDVPTNEWTWDDYREIAVQLTNADEQQWGTVIRNGVGAWGAYVVSKGGEILNDERTECRLTEPEAVEALQFYFGLLTEDEASVPPGALPQTPEAGDQFLSGIAATIMAGPWFRPGLVENDPFNWAIRLLPRVPGTNEPPTTLLYTDQWGMSADTEHPDEAWALLKFFGGEEGQTLWSEIYGSRSITPIQELAESDDWLNYGGEEHRADNQAILDQLERTTPPPTNFADGAEVENVWNEQLELVIVGQQDVDQAVQTICETITPVLQS